MGRRLPILKAKELIRVLRILGFIFIRQKGSHAFYQHPVSGKSTIVSIHGGEDIDRGLLKAILQETNIDPEEFLTYL